MVVGGGPTGVEIAGQIASLAGLDEAQLPPDRSDRGQVVLVDAVAAGILATFGDSLARKAQGAARAPRGDDPDGLMVTGVDALGVDVKAADGQWSG